MKILTCPKCNKQLFAENCNGTTILQCAFCGYVDYEYLFDTPYLYRGTKDNLNIENVIEIISKNVCDIRDKTIDINAFVCSLAEKWRDLSPVAICEIINSFNDTYPCYDISQANESLFVEYVPDKISLQDILDKNIDVERKIIDAIKKQASYDEDIECLKTENKTLTANYSKLEKSYIECVNLLQEKEKLIDSLFQKLDDVNK